MELSPSLEASSSLTDPEFDSILCNTKVCYRVLMSSIMVPIQLLIIPVDNIKTDLGKQVGLVWMRFIWVKTHDYLQVLHVVNCCMYYFFLLRKVPIRISEGLKLNRMFWKQLSLSFDMTQTTCKTTLLG
jgi:hypothetical protein